MIIFIRLLEVQAIKFLKFQSLTRKIFELSEFCQGKVHFKLIGEVGKRECGEPRETPYEGAVRVETRSVERNRTVDRIRRDEVLLLRFLLRV